MSDVGNAFPAALDPASSHGQLAGAAGWLFPDEDLAAFYTQSVGCVGTPHGPLP